MQCRIIIKSMPAETATWPGGAAGLTSSRIARWLLVAAGAFMLVLVLVCAGLALVSSARLSPLERGPNVLAPQVLTRVAAVCAAISALCFWFAHVVKRISRGRRE
jgi:hypothetical protein